MCFSLCDGEKIIENWFVKILLWDVIEAHLISWLEIETFYVDRGLIFEGSTIKKLINSFETKNNVENTHRLSQVILRKYW